jgi:anti-anti-sigma factor
VECTIEDHSGVHVVRLRGELDGSTPWLSDVTTLLTGPGATVVVDLGEVTFISSTGLSELVRLAAQGNTQEARVILARPTAPVAGLFAVTHLDRFFDIRPSLAAALPAAG